MPTCKFCGEPTSEHEFFTIPSGRVWTHFKCFTEEAERLSARGAFDEFDDVTFVIDWPDGPAEITTGKRMRKGK